MRFDAKMKKQSHEELWNEYCGFLDIDIDQYMQIQNRLMQEQIDLWSQSGIGRSILGRRKPQTVTEFRRRAPLTTFSNYAECLLKKDASILPSEPVIWIQTTWEGGKNPVKLAPYSRSMLDTYKSNCIASLLLCTSTKRGQFSVRPGDKTLYGFAPLPFVTGLFPVSLSEEIDLKYLPSLKEGNALSFGERNKVGLSLGLKQGIDLFFGLSSVISYITENFSGGGSSSGGKSILSMSPKTIFRYLKASSRTKQSGEPIRPKDIFKLKGLVCAGTDTESYKPFLEENWGIRPMEIAAGTEPTIIGTETWQRNGLVFFPDACFYEFIPESEMIKNIDDPDYTPNTVLMNEIQVNRNYELVISVLKGGAFMRYRVGDVYRCVAMQDKASGVMLPHLSFVDRVPTVIDIAGFTRITENTISDVIRLSGMSISDWIASKEYSPDQRPYLHMYIEMDPGSFQSEAVSKSIITDQLSIYFKYFDTDYNDLKRLLGVEPLVITFLRSGTIERYRRTGRSIRRINPPSSQVIELLALQETFSEFGYSIVKGGLERS